MGYPQILLEVETASTPISSGPFYWEDLTSRTGRIKVRRGRQSELDRFEAGTIDALLENADGHFPLSVTDQFGSSATWLGDPSFEASPLSTSWDGASSWHLTAGSTITSETGDGMAVYDDACAKVVTTAASSQQGIRHNNGVVTTNVTSGLTYTFSIWVKGNAGSEPLRIAMGGSGLGNATFDVTPTTRWKRYFVVYTATGTGAAQVAVYTRTATACTFFVDGAQVDLGAKMLAWAKPSASKVLRPGNRIRFSAFHSSTGLRRRQFAGWAEGWKPEKTRGIRYDSTALTGVDVMALLAPAKFAGTRSAERTDQRIAYVLDQVGVAAADRDLDVGQTSVPGYDFDRYDAVRHAYECADAEQGQLYVTKAGKIKLENRYKRSMSYVTSNATFADDGTALPYEDIQVDFDWSLVYNEVTVATNTGVPQEETDTNSTDWYLDRALSRTLWLTSDAEADSVAQYLLARYKEVVARVRSLRLDPTVSDAVETQVLERDISDRITVKFRIGLTVMAGDYHIESVEHDINPGRSWRTTWSLSPAEIWSFWILDSSTNSVLGDTTRVGY